MKHIVFFLSGLLYFFYSCSPAVSTAVINTYESLDYYDEVKVIGLIDPTPENYEVLGVVKVENKAFYTKNCEWEDIILKAKEEARKLGGNAIKITNHQLPDTTGSSCHCLSADILKVENPANIVTSQFVDSALINADYALLHIYRECGVGELVNYDLYMGDSVICRVTNKYKRTIRISQEGTISIWAQTEEKDELPIELKNGNEYYIRCSIAEGEFVGRPKIELVDKLMGRKEYLAVKTKKKDDRDLIITNDGREVECVINKEDNDYVYFTLYKNEKEKDTKLSKSQIEIIQRRE